MQAANRRRFARTPRSSTGVSFGIMGLATAAALSFDSDDLRVVYDAVVQRGGAGGVWEDRRPLGEREVRGQHEALALVAAADDLDSFAPMSGRDCAIVPDLLLAPTLAAPSHPTKTV